MKDIKFKKLLDSFRDSNSVKNHIKIDEQPNLENAFDFNNSKLESILFDYYKLSTLEELSEIEAKHLDKILELAETDKNLSLILNEIDEITFEELDFYEKESLEKVENQKAKAKEFIINSEKNFAIGCNLSMQSISDYQDILNEYYKLTTLEELTELDAKRLDKILKQAETNENLTLLLNEIDELTYQELGLYKPDSLEDHENQKAKVKEFILNSEDEVTSDNPKEKKDKLISHSKYTPAIAVVNYDNKSTRMILGGIVCFLTFSAWAGYGEIEKVAKFQKNLLSKGETYKIESIELWKRSHITVKEGEEVKVGQLLAELDTTLAVKEVERLEQIIAASKIELSQKQAQLKRVYLEIQTHERISAAETLRQRLAINSAKYKAQVLRQLLAQQKAEIEAYQTRQKLVASVPQISQERFEQVNLELEAYKERLARLRELEKSGGVSKEFIFQAEQAQRQTQLQLIANKVQKNTNVSEQLFQAEQSLRNLAERKTESQRELASALKEIEQLEADLKRPQAERSRMILDAEEKIQQLKLEITQIETKIAETQNLLSSAQAKLFFNKSNQ